MLCDGKDDGESVSRQAMHSDGSVRGLPSGGRSEIVC